VLQKAGAADERPALPATHNHYHTDQSYYPSPTLIPNQVTADSYSCITFNNALLPEGVFNDIDRPPSADYSFLSFI